MKRLARGGRRRKRRLVYANLFFSLFLFVCLLFWYEQLKQVPYVLLSDASDAPTILQPAKDDPRPRNLRMAFLGDSVTRYQYVSLVYWLKYNRWIAIRNTTTSAEDSAESSHSKILFKWNYPALNQFLQESNQILVPEEACDCFMPQVGPPHRVVMGYYVENRYFRQPELGNAVYFVNKYGFRPSQGHHSAQDMTSKHLTTGMLWNATLQDPSNHTKHFAWQGNWSYTIRNHIAILEPKPNILIFNAGLHPNDLSDPSVRSEIRQTCQEFDILPVYKTTTYPDKNTRKTRFSRSRHDWILKREFTPFLNMIWTADYNGEEHYYDANHFKPHINTMMNQQLLDFLRKHQTVSQPLFWHNHTFLKTPLSY